MTTTTTVAIPKPSIVQFNIGEQCPIQFVTVYNDRAEVTRLVRHQFDAEGTYDLVFEGFSSFVDLTSLHVSGGTSKACTILEVTYETRFENSTIENDSTVLEQLQKELRSTEEEIDKHKQELVRIGKQRAWIEGRASKLMNQNNEKNSAIDLEALEQFLDFYYKQLLKLDNETTNEESQIKTLTEKAVNLRAKISEYGADGQANQQKQIRLVTITVHIGATNADVSLEIAYLISNCSWTASYDVRVNSTDSTRQPQTQLTYYGIIVNKSQEDWSDVQLALSTAAPSLGGALPKLATLKINFETQVFRYAKKSAFFSVGGSSSLSLSIPRGVPQMRARRRLSTSHSNSDGDDDDDNTINVLSTRTETSMSSTSFSIPRRTTIEADGKPHKVTIGVLDLTSTFTYTVIPKLSLHAYLKASTINSSDRQLLAGPASVFMNNNFITHSAIDNVCLGDKFDLPLGVDASVKVDYKPVKKLADTHGFISKVHHENVRHEIHVKNLKSTDVIVYIYDQVPLSSDETIKIKVIQPDLRIREQSTNCTVLLNDDNNIEWKCVLAAHGECRLPLEYSMEWPNDKRIEFKQT